MKKPATSWRRPAGVAQGSELVSDLGRTEDVANAVCRSVGPDGDGKFDGFANGVNGLGAPDFVRFDAFARCDEEADDFGLGLIASDNGSFGSFDDSAADEDSLWQGRLWIH